MSRLKANFSKKPAKKIFSPMAGKLNLNLALQPSTASTAKIQIQFSRHWTKDFLAGFLEKLAFNKVFKEVSNHIFEDVF